MKSKLMYSVVLKNKVNVSLAAIQTIGWLFNFIGIAVLQTRVDHLNVSVTMSGFWWHSFYTLFLLLTWCYVLMTARLHEYRIAVLVFFTIAFVYLSEDATLLLALAHDESDDGMSAGAGLSAAGAIFLCLAYSSSLVFFGSILGESFINDQRNMRMFILGNTPGQDQSGRNTPHGNHQPWESAAMLKQQQMQQQNNLAIAATRPNPESMIYPSGIINSHATPQNSTMVNNGNNNNSNNDNSPVANRMSSRQSMVDGNQPKPDGQQQQQGRQPQMSVVGKPGMPLASASTPLKAVALFSYSANPEDPIEISFNKGEMLEIIDNKGKWWQAKRKLKDGSTITGIVPSNYVELV